MEIKLCYLLILYSIASYTLLDPIQWTTLVELPTLARQLAKISPALSIGRGIGDCS